MLASAFRGLGLAWPQALAYLSTRHVAALECLRLPNPARTWTQHWSMALLVASLAWAGLVAAVPFLITHHHGNAAMVHSTAAFTYFIGSLICHQRPERSFHPLNVQAPVCARCEGIYLAAPFGVGLMLAAHRARMRETNRSTLSLPNGSKHDPDWSTRRLWQRILLLACGPTVLTLGWEWTMGDMPSAMMRAAAGAVLGAAIAAMVAAVALGELR